MVNKYQQNIGSFSEMAHLPPFGQCYAISDGSPIDNFEMLKPLCEARLCDYPTLVIPTNAMLFFALLIEIMHKFFLYLGIPNSPFLTRSEVQKVINVSTCIFLSLLTQ